MTDTKVNASMVSVAMTTDAVPIGVTKSPSPLVRTRILSLPRAWQAPQDQTNKLRKNYNDKCVFPRHESHTTIRMPATQAATTSCVKVTTLLRPVMARKQAQAAAAKQLMRISNVIFMLMKCMTYQKMVAMTDNMTIPKSLYLQISHR
jgi:hypothetical protein